MTSRVCQPCTWSVEQKKNIFSLCPRSFAPENWVSRDGFGSPVPRQPAHLHSRAESSAHLGDYFRVPRRRPFSYLKQPLVLIKNLNASKPSEHRSSGEIMSKGLSGNIGCRDKTSSWYQTGSPMKPHRVSCMLSGRSPPLYCTHTLISMQGHQNHNPFNPSRNSGLQ